MSEKKPIPIMRTIQECLKVIKDLDPDTAVKESFLRRILEANRVRHFKSGNKYIVDLTDLLRVLNGFEQDGSPIIKGEKLL
jgi:hypothetical protein